MSNFIHLRRDGVDIVKIDVFSLFNEQCDFLDKGEDVLDEVYDMHQTFIEKLVVIR